MTVDVGDSQIAVSRVGSAIIVVIREDRPTPRLVSRMRQVLVDLVDGQGNRSVILELPEAVALDADILDVVIEVADLLVGRHGSLTLRTARTGSPNPTRFG